MTQVSSKQSPKLLVTIQTFNHFIIQMAKMDRLRFLGQIFKYMLIFRDENKEIILAEGKEKLLVQMVENL